MAKNPWVTQSVAQARLTAFETAANAGTAAVIQGYTGTQPADGDAAEAGTLLFTLTCSAAIFSAKNDGNPGAVGVFDTITQDSSADNTGTLTHFLIMTQAGGTRVFHGSAGVGTFDMDINTTAITSGSAVTCGSASITDPEG